MEIDINEFKAKLGYYNSNDYDYCEKFIPNLESYRNNRKINKYDILVLFDGIPMPSYENMKYVADIEPSKRGMFLPCDVMHFFSHKGIYTTNNMDIDNSLGNNEFLIRKGYRPIPFVFVYKLKDEIHRIQIKYDAEKDRWETTINGKPYYQKYIYDIIEKLILHYCPKCNPYVEKESKGGYLHKYMKYKQKYLILKNKLN